MSAQKITLVPLPPESGRSEYRMPDIYAGYKYIDKSHKLDEYMVGDVLLYSNCTYEILEILMQRRVWRIRRFESSNGSATELETPFQHPACGIMRPWAGASRSSRDDMYPHTCLRCGGPAYIGGNNNVDCKRKCA